MRENKNRTLDPLLSAGIGVVSPRRTAAIATKIAPVLLNEVCCNFLLLYSDRTHVLYQIVLFAECSNGLQQIRQNT